MQKKDRIDYIDIAKALGIFLVLLGHTVAADTLTKTVLYSFHMPLFFFISGMLIKVKNDDCKWSSILLKKAQHLLFPYLIWGLIYSAFSFKNLLFIMYGSRESLIKAGSLTSLWFLPVMFISVILAEIIVWSLRNVKCQSLIIALCCAAFSAIGCILPHHKEYGDPWGIDVAFIALAFVLLGYLVRRFIDILIKSKVIIRILTFVICVGTLALSVWLNNPLEGYVLMANGIYGNILLFLLGAVSGIFALILASEFISHISFGKKQLLFVGQNTLGIFIIHKPFVELGRKILTHIGMDYNNIIIAIINALIWLAVSAIIVLVINMFLPELFGKRKNS